MAGVNLAEETQRILGPSEFVGTQIRSCKDETFLHTHPLTMRIIDIGEFPFRLVSITLLFLFRQYSILLTCVFFVLKGVLIEMKKKKKNVCKIIARKHGLDEPNPEVVALVSHAAQERLKNILEKLNVIAEHRVDFNKVGVVTSTYLKMCSSSNDGRHYFVRVFAG